MCVLCLALIVTKSLRHEIPNINPKHKCKNIDDRSPADNNTKKHWQIFNENFKAKYDSFTDKLRPGKLLNCFSSHSYVLMAYVILIMESFWRKIYGKIEYI